MNKYQITTRNYYSEEYKQLLIKAHWYEIGDDMICKFYIDDENAKAKRMIAAFNEWTCIIQILTDDDDFYGEYLKIFEKPKTNLRNFNEFGWKDKELTPPPKDGRFLIFKILRKNPGYIDIYDTNSETPKEFKYWSFLPDEPNPVKESYNADLGIKIP